MKDFYSCFIDRAFRRFPANIYQADFHYGDLQFEANLFLKTLSSGRYTCNFHSRLFRQKCSNRRDRFGNNYCKKPLKKP